MKINESTLELTLADFDTQHPGKIFSYLQNPFIQTVKMELNAFYFNKEMENLFITHLQPSPITELIIDWRDLDQLEFSSQFAHALCQHTNIKQLTLHNFNLNQKFINEFEQGQLEELTLYDIAESTYKPLLANSSLPKEMIIFMKDEMIPVFHSADKSYINKSSLLKIPASNFNDKFLLALLGVQRLLSTSLIIKNQEGFTCGYYALFHAAQAFFPSHFFSPRKKSSTTGVSLKEIGKRGINGIGAIYDINDFAELVKESTPLIPIVLEMKNENQLEFINAIRAALQFGSVILPCDLEKGNGNFAHYVTVMGHIKEHLIIVNYGNLVLLDSNTAFSSNNTLTTCAEHSANESSKLNRPKNFKYPTIDLTDKLKNRLLLLVDTHTYKSMQTDKKFITHIEPFIIQTQSVSVACAKGLLTKENLPPKEDIDKFNTNGKTLFYIACENGQLGMLKLLLDAGANPHQVSFNNVSPLVAACERGQLDVLIFFQENKITFSQDLLNEALLVACGKGHQLVVERLLTLGAKINTTDTNGWTPMLRACEKGHFAIIKLLSENGSKMHARNYQGLTPFLAACGCGKIEVVRWFIEKHHINLHTTLSGALTLACKNGFLEVAEELIKLGMNPNFDMDIAGITPLCAAIKNKQLNMIKFLLKHKTQIARGFGAEEPLILAVKQGDEKILELLLNASDSFDYQKLFLLHEAVSYGHHHLIPLLIKFGYAIDSLDDSRESPLDISIEKGEILVVKKLLENGAQKELKTNPTLIYKALVLEKNEIAMLLIENGVNIHHSYQGGNGLLYFASKFNNSEIVKYLLLHGADPHKTNHLGKTPLSIACEKGHYKIVKLMLAKNPPLKIIDCIEIANNNGHNKVIALLIKEISLKEWKQVNVQLLDASIKRDNYDFALQLIKEGNYAFNLIDYITLSSLILQLTNAGEKELIKTLFIKMLDDYIFSAKKNPSSSENLLIYAALKIKAIILGESNAEIDISTKKIIESNEQLHYIVHWISTDLLNLDNQPQPKSITPPKNDSGLNFTT